VLRRLPTGRLLAVCALVAVVAATLGAVAAGAFGGGGPVPPRKPLAPAIHDALAAPAVNGVTADIQFTDRLIDTSGVRGANPLLSGASGRLWATRDRLRLELQAPSGSEGAGDVQVLLDRHSFSVLDVASNTLYRASLPADTHPRTRHHNESAPSVSTIKQALGRLTQHVTVTGPNPRDVAGQPAYSVSLAPKRNGGLLGHVNLSWDAGKGLPLSVAVYARGSSSPVLALQATQISFGSVPASVFALTPGPHTKVVNLTPPAAKTHAAKHGTHRHVTGLSAVQSKVGFQLAAPAALAGRHRTQVSQVGGGAVIAYGDGLGGILVFERRHDSHQHSLTLPKSGGRSDRQLQLPTVQLPGATATEIATPLGTLIQFDRGAVDYTVVGSVTKSTAEAAARGL